MYIINDLLAIYFDEYHELSDIKRKKMEPSYDPNKLFLKTLNYHAWFENEILRSVWDATKMSWRSKRTSRIEIFIPSIKKY